MGMCVCVYERGRVSVCVCLQLLYAAEFRHVAYVLHMQSVFPILCGWEAVIWCICEELSAANVHVCVCVHTVIISTSVFDGSLHTEHMDGCMYMYLVSSECTWAHVRAPTVKSVHERVRASTLVLLAIYFSEWVASHMPVVWERVCTSVGACVCVRACVRSSVLAQAPCVCGCEVKCLLAGLGWRAGGEQRWNRRFAEKTRTTSPITTFSSSPSVCVSPRHSLSSYSCCLHLRTALPPLPPQTEISHPPLSAGRIRWSDL